MNAKLEKWVKLLGAASFAWAGQAMATPATLVADWGTDPFYIDLAHTVALTASFNDNYAFDLSLARLGSFNYVAVTVKFYGVPILQINNGVTQLSSSGPDHLPGTIDDFPVGVPLITPPDTVGQQQWYLPVGHYVLNIQGQPVGQFGGTYHLTAIFTDTTLSGDLGSVPVPLTVPEPSTAALLGAALAAGALAARSRRQRKPGQR